MYKAKQCKEKVSRRIDAGSMARQMMNNRMLSIQRLNVLKKQKNSDLNTYSYVSLESIKKTGNIIQRQRLKKGYMRITLYCTGGFPGHIQMYFEDKLPDKNGFYNITRKQAFHLTGPKNEQDSNSSNMQKSLFASGARFLNWIMDGKGRVEQFINNGEKKWYPITSFNPKENASDLGNDIIKESIVVNIEDGKNVLKYVTDNMENKVIRFGLISGNINRRTVNCCTFAYNALKAGKITFNSLAYLASFISPNLALRIGKLVPIQRIYNPSRRMCHPTVNEYKDL